MNQSSLIILLLYCKRFLFFFQYIRKIFNKIENDFSFYFKSIFFFMKIEEFYLEKVNMSLKNNRIDVQFIRYREWRKYE